MLDRGSVRQDPLAGVELQGGVVLRDFPQSDRSDFLAIVADDSMYEYMKFRLDVPTAVRQFEYLVVEIPSGEFAGWAGLGGRGDGGDAEFGWCLTSRHWGCRS